MRLPNIDQILEDFPSIAGAHQYYRNWIDDNLSESRLEHIHASSCRKFTSSSEKPTAAFPSSAGRTLAR
jgi:hypothetical protein